MHLNPRTAAGPLLAALLLMTLDVRTAAAGGWEIDPQMSAAFNFNDNPALEPDSVRDRDNRDAIFAAVTNLEADIEKLEPGSSITLRPRIRGYYYPDKNFDQLNRFDYYLRGNAAKTGQLLNLSLGFSYDNQSVLSAEDYNPEDGSSGSNNFDRPEDKRERFQVAPSIIWTPTEKDSVTVGGSFSRTDHKLDFSGRSDIDNAAYTLVYDRRVSERQSVGVFATYLDSSSERLDNTTICQDGSLPDVLTFPPCADSFLNPFPPPFFVDINGNEYVFLREAATIENETTSDSINLSYSFLWSKMTTITLNYGTQTTDSVSTTTVVSTGDSRPINNGFESNQYNVNLRNRGERYNVELTAIQGVSIQSDGTPSDNTSLRFRYRYELTPKLNVQFDTFGQLRKARSESIVREIRYFRGDIRTSWRLRENLSASLLYIYRYQDPDTVRLDDIEVSEEENEKRSSNSVSLLLTYQF